MGISGEGGEAAVRRCFFGGLGGSGGGGLSLNRLESILVG